MQGRSTVSKIVFCCVIFLTSCHTYLEDCTTVTAVQNLSYLNIRLKVISGIYWSVRFHEVKVSLDPEETQISSYVNVFQITLLQIAALQH